MVKILRHEKHLNENFQWTLNYLGILSAWHLSEFGSSTQCNTTVYVARIVKKVPFLHLFQIQATVLRNL